MAGWGYTAPGEQRACQRCDVPIRGGIGDCAYASGGRITVELQAVPAEGALGQLRGNDNLVAFHTRYYPDTPLVLQGRGAGVDAAAAGVHADIVALTG